MNTYDKLASFYDYSKLEEDYDHFINQYLNIALSNGFKGNTILDIGCGTGASMLPLLEKGYKVDGVDNSAQMLKKAELKLETYNTNLFDMDITDLMINKKYDLITAVDDVLNHILSIEGVEACIESVANLLNEEGFFLFDMNTQHTFEHFFNSTTVYEEEDLTIINQSKFVDDLGIARITAFMRNGDVFLKEQTNLIERFYSAESISKVLEKHGLILVNLYGYKDRNFHEEDKEPDNLKILFVARRKPVSL